VVRTQYAYDLANLLYDKEYFAPRTQLHVANRPYLINLISDLLLPSVRVAFKFLQTSTRDNSKQRDEAARELATVFEQDRYQIPVRLPSISEVLTDSELSIVFSRLQTLDFGDLDKAFILDAVGNYFCPSAFQAAVSGSTDAHGILGFVESKATGLQPMPLSPQQAATLYDSYKLTVAGFGSSLSSQQVQAIVPDGHKYLLSNSYLEEVKANSGRAVENIDFVSGKFTNQGAELSKQVSVYEKPTAIPRASLPLKAQSFVSSSLVNFEVRRDRLLWLGLSHAQVQRLDKLDDINMHQNLVAELTSLEFVSTSTSALAVFHQPVEGKAVTFSYVQPLRPPCRILVVLISRKIAHAYEYACCISDEGTHTGFKQKQVFARYLNEFRLGLDVSPFDWHSHLPFAQQIKCPVSLSKINFGIVISTTRGPEAVFFFQERISLFGYSRFEFGAYYSHVFGVPQQYPKFQSHAATGEDLLQPLLVELVAEAYEVLEKFSVDKTSFVISSTYRGPLDGAVDLSAESIKLVHDCVDSGHLVLDLNNSYSTTSSGFDIFSSLLATVHISNNPLICSEQLHSPTFGCLLMVIRIGNAFGLFTMPVCELEHHPKLVASLAAGLTLDEPME
jgi:hypothetical protein